MHAEYMTVAYMRQLFAGIRFLHKTAQLVHRDIEAKHVGIAGGRLCVFDLSTCVPLSQQQGTSNVLGYSGGLLASAISNSSDARPQFWRRFR